MPYFSIQNTHSGLYLGDYEASSKDDALDVMAQDAGYENYAELSKEVPAKPGEILVLESVMLHGKPVNYQAAVNLMDDELREELNSRIGGCTEQEFLDTYVEEHAKKFDGEVFVVN